MIRNPFRDRLKLVAVLCLFPFFLIVPRLAWLQVVEVESLDRQAELQNIRRERIPPRRGEILDRNRVRLAYSVRDTVVEAGQVGFTRVYPLGPAASTVLGVVTASGGGAYGIESQFDRELRGHPGWATHLRNAGGETYLLAGRRERPARSGYDLVLTLDGPLQEIAAARLRRGVEETGASSGALVAVDPRTGEVLAMASWPSFDPEHLKGAPRSHFMNRVVTFPYEPGSTFKLIPVVAALRENIVQPSTVIYCENGTYYFGKRRVRDHEKLGYLTFKDCFAHSSNIAMAKVGKDCDSLLYDVADAFGVGRLTGITLPGEEPGVLYPYRKWSGFSSVSLSMGYETLVTPLQLVMAYAAVANDGVLLRPRILKEVLDEQGNVVHRSVPEPVRRVIEPALAGTVRSFMRRVITDGTGTAAALEWTEVAGKTGTTEKLSSDDYDGTRHLASFVGMAPAEDPRVVMLVVLDEPTELSRRYGGSAAAPIFREVLEAYARIPGARLRPRPEELVISTDGGEGGGLLGPDTALAGPAENHETGLTEEGLPNVTNWSLRAALIRLRDAGVQVQVQGSGRVLSQDPPPGTLEVSTVRLVAETPGAVNASFERWERASGTKGKSASGVRSP